MSEKTEFKKFYIKNIIIFSLLILLSGAATDLPAYRQPADPDRCSVMFDPFHAKGEFRLNPAENKSVALTLPLNLTGISYTIVNSSGKSDPLISLPEDQTELKVRKLFRNQTLSVRFSLKKDSFLFTKTDLYMKERWHPQPSSFCRYDLTVTVPAGFTAVSESESEYVRALNNGREEHRLLFPHPLDSLTLIASSNYTVMQKSITSVSGKKIRIRTLMLKGDEDLHNLYINKTEYYIKLYEKLFSEFPYRSFTVAASDFPAGYSLPSYTVIGRRILRFPFVYENSLGHEVLHQWFGNGVHVSYEHGNWSEGLTTYFADHYYKFLEGSDDTYRKTMLLTYQKQINENPEADFSISDFRTNKGGIHQSVGYGKTAAVFHNLRSQLGPEVFLAGIRNFLKENMYQKAGWQEIQASFEKVSKKNLSYFFNFWLKEKGLIKLPEISATVNEIRTPYRKSTVYETAVHITGDHDFRKTGGINVKISGPPGESRTAIIKDKKVKIMTTFYPLEIYMDPYYDIPRYINQEEIPFTISRFLEGKSWILYHEGDNDEGAGIYGQLVDFLKGAGASENDIILRSSQNPDYSELRSHNIIITGKNNPLRLPLYGSVNIPDSGSFVSVFRSPWNSSLTVTHLWAENEEEVRRLLRVLPRYGNYSEISYKNGKPNRTELRDHQSGVKISLHAQRNKNPAAVQAKFLDESGPEAERTYMIAASDKRSIAVKLEDIKESEISSLRNSKIIYLGEQHDLFSHHLSQVSWIRFVMGIKGINPEYAAGRFAIALEMFPRESQNVLDEFIYKKINEKEFIKKSNYYAHWGFDYELYRPIFLFARENGIRLIALNAPRNLVRETGRKGIHGLSPSDQDALPSSMDFSDENYRKFLSEIFSQHNRESSERMFENFVQAQVLWDEYMAESIYKYILANPETDLAVIAGNGHLRYFRGIPDRVFRRNGLPFLVILHDDDQSPGIADIVTVTDKNIRSGAIKLGVYLKEIQEGLLITKTEPESPAKNSGLREGDIITGINDEEIRTTADLRAALVFQEYGRPLQVNVIRQKEKMIFSVSF